MGFHAVSIEEALEHRHLAEVHWVEPSPGLDEKGGEVTATRRVRMTVSDAIRACRALPMVRRRKRASDEECLNHWVAVHWADLVMDDMWKD